MTDIDSAPNNPGTTIGTYGSDDYLEPSTEIVLAVADRSDRPVDELPPLFQVLDPESLDRLLEDTDNSTVSVAFEYVGYRIVVSADGTLEIGPLDA